jgi:hypothetical protein
MQASEVPCCESLIIAANLALVIGMLIAREALPETNQLDSQRSPEKIYEETFETFVCTDGLPTVTGCVEQPNQANKNAVASPSPSATASPSPAEEKAAKAEPLTLPVLNAFFAEESFSGALKTRLQLSDEQVTKLKELAHAETAKLNEENAGKRQRRISGRAVSSSRKISALIGSDKMRQLAALVGERWNSTGDEASDKTATPHAPNNRASVAALLTQYPRIRG